MPNPSPLNTITRLNSSAKDLLIYIYELAPLDVDLLFVLLKVKKPLTLEDLAKKLNRDKTTILRSTQKLVGSGIAIKETRTLRGGGYYHIYSAIDVETFRLQTERKVKEIKESFDRILKKFEDDVNNSVASFYR
jgi:predicted transcriptional regulator